MTFKHDAASVSKKNAHHSLCTKSTLPYIYAYSMLIGGGKYLLPKEKNPILKGSFRSTYLVSILHASVAVYMSFMAIREHARAAANINKSPSDSERSEKGHLVVALASSPEEGRMDSKTLWQRLWNYAESAEYTPNDAGYFLSDLLMDYNAEFLPHHLLTTLLFEISLRNSVMAGTWIIAGGAFELAVIPGHFASLFPAPWLLTLRTVTYTLSRLAVLPFVFAGLKMTIFKLWVSGKRGSAACGLALISIVYGQNLWWAYLMMRNLLM